MTSARTYTYTGTEFPRLTGHDFTVTAFAAVTGLTPAEVKFRIRAAGGDKIADIASRPPVYKCVNCWHSEPAVNQWGLCPSCERAVVQQDAEAQRR